MLSCTKSKSPKPLLLSNIDTVNIQNMDVHFKTNFKSWKAFLFSFNQPIPLKTKFKDGILQVSYSTKKNNVETDAQIVLMDADTFFSYKTYMKNLTSTVNIIKDYRSPKTVNSDSSLHHDRIFYVLDNGQNIQSINGNLFVQEQIQLSSKVQTVNAIKGNNLSAYYMQPGSLKKIEIYVAKSDVQEKYIISTKVLKDDYNNIVANGTKIMFKGTKNDSIVQFFKPVINGIASIELPINLYKGIQMQAVSQQIHSNFITLK